MAGKPAPTAAAAPNPFATGNAQTTAPAAGQSNVAAGAVAAGTRPPAAGTAHPSATPAPQANTSATIQAKAPADAANTNSPSTRTVAPVFKPSAQTKSTTLPNGTMLHVSQNTKTSIRTDAGGHILGVDKPGLSASSFRSDGRAAHIERTGADGSRMIVARGFNGERRTEVIRPGGVRVVTFGNRGFVERPFRPGYVSRTYLVGGGSRTLVYRTGFYGTYAYRTYVPGVVYAPAFYGWAARPWYAPVPYVWPSAPWVGAYRGFYAPERSYADPAHWIAAFIVAANLSAAYEARTAAGSTTSSPVQTTTNVAPMSAEVKDMLAKQVQHQIEAEQQAAALPAAPATAAATETRPAALDARYRVFVVHTDIDLAPGANGQTCTLTPGDVVQRTSEEVSSDGKVAVVIVSSKSAECPALFQTAIDLETLQDMHNQFRLHLAAGLEKLASNSGANGIPVAPAANAQLLSEGQAPPDEQAKSLLTTQSSEADEAEEEVKLAASGNN